MKPRGLTVKDRVGQRIGRLTVMWRAPNKAEGIAIRACWVCLCDCGNAITATGHTLNKALSGKGGTQSCGCLNRENPTKHGKAGSKIYGAWNIMLQRCSNPKNPAYQSYGGRGITVCKEWRDFRAFYADMGDRPPNRTLDRIDNSLGYFKGNCRWATKTQQGNNRRTNRFLTFHGKKKTLAEWAKFTGLGTHCLRSRILAGWPIEKAFKTPKQISAKT